MFLQFIGVNEKIVNLSAIVLIEDLTTEVESVAQVTTITGDELTFVGSDADAIFQRAELMMQATDAAINQLLPQRPADI